MLIGWHALPVICILYMQIRVTGSEEAFCLHRQAFERYTTSQHLKHQSCCYILDSLLLTVVAMVTSTLPESTFSVMKMVNTVLISEMRYAR